MERLLNMSNRSGPTILLDLQKADLRVDELTSIRENLIEREEIKKLNKRIKELRKEIENLYQEKRSTELDQKRINDEISILTVKIKSEEEKLYSGRITNPKELEGINKEVIFLKLKMDKKETKILELMEEIDENLKVIQLKEKELDGNLSEIKTKELNLTQREKEIDKEMSELTDRRNNLISHLDTEILKEYESLREEKGGRVVAVLEDGICSCCNMQLPSIKVDSMRDPNIFYHCNFCERILILT